MVAMKHERPSLEPMFDLTLLGYCRNIAVHHVGLYGRGSAPCVDIKGSSMQQILFSWKYTPIKTYLLNFHSSSAKSVPLDATKSYILHV